MEFGSVKGISKKVSRLVQGCMMLGDLGQEQSDSLLDACVAAGINTFDNGHSYGEWIEDGICERVLGKWIQSRGNREDIVVIDKGCHPNKDRAKVTPFDIEADLNNSLARLKTDYLDLWLFHRDDPSVPVGPLMETLNRYVDNGKIKAFGCSNWTRERIEEANAYCEKNNIVPFAASSPGFSLAAPVQPPFGGGAVTISGPENKEIRAWYRETRMPVFTWSSLARGFFSGRINRRNFEQVKDQFEDFTLKAYVSDENWERMERAEKLAAEKNLTMPQIALSFVLSQSFNVFTIVGAVSETEIQANIAAVECKLGPEEIDWLDLKTDDLIQ